MGPHREVNGRSSPPQEDCEISVAQLTVASLQTLHFTTCWCILPSTLMRLWQTRQVIMGVLPLSGLAMGE